MWNRDFLLLWHGMAESRIGSVLYSIAIGIWVYDQTDSAALMGIMTSLSYFGALVLQPFGGALADRCSKRALMIGSDAVCGVAMLALGGGLRCAGPSRSGSCWPSRRSARSARRCSSRPSTA